MSVNSIKKEDTVEVKRNGKTYYENPQVSLCIDLFGGVYKKSQGKFEKLKPSKWKTYNTYVFGKQTNISYNTLFSRMVLGNRLGGKTLQLIDAAKGYVDGNIEIVSSASKSIDGVRKSSKTEVKANVYLQEPNNGKIHYELLSGETNWITEDGGEFPTKEIAEWHQTNVSKGKGNAQVVLDFNGGYVLAEQIFLQEVKYNKEKPYLNFKAVMDNNSGIVEETTPSKVLFNRNKMPVRCCASSLIDFTWLEGYECDLEKAEKLNDNLNKMIDAWNYFDSIATLTNEIK